MTSLQKIYAAIIAVLRLVLNFQSTLSAIKTQLDKQEQTLQEILEAVQPLPAVGFTFRYEVDGVTQEIPIEMTNSQQLTASITPVDKKGNPAPIDGIPVWASSDETILTVEAASDGLSATVKAVGPTGTAKVSVTGDADLGTGVQPIFGESDPISVTPGAAVGFKMTLGPATEQGGTPPTP